MALTSAVNYDTDDSPGSVAIGDLNGDTNLDLAASSESGVSVLLGNGDASFQSVMIYGAGWGLSLGSGPLSVAIDDLNGDANLDMAVANFYTDNVSIFINIGRADAVPINIDIKPSNDRNIINPRSRGGIWVAVLSDTDPESLFDPSSQVDIPTVEFGPDGAKAKRHKVKDINKDGLGDLLLRFKIPETGIACGDMEATLTGETFDGLSFIGTDSIKTVGCKPKKCHKKKHYDKHHYEKHHGMHHGNNHDDDCDDDEEHHERHYSKHHDDDRDDDHRRR